VRDIKHVWKRQDKTLITNTVERFSLFDFLSFSHISRCFVLSSLFPELLNEASPPGLRGLLKGACKRRHTADKNLFLGFAEKVSRTFSRALAADADCGPVVGCSFVWPQDAG
jgi:hypothetical protein